ncbi:hypothetical protein FC27_GL000302 [Companilactobacillus versmoldensis DSM 14857 = KCTC 3814]|uniref:DUF2255 family protein n=2 Tax=Companilactobacillus versmoldensis TaxID=194326 RepID=A0A0R1SLJ5_9LACO|nr:hypothetical protein FC27_GL000302 [Companilactobacillus versmoldensis DSM 14857 = KCTC 3814]
MELLRISSIKEEIKMAEKTWTEEQLKDFSKADDFKVSPFYDDGKTYGTPTWIWSVVVDGNLFIRAYNGQNSRWYNSAITQKAGRIFLAGENHEVTFKKLEDTSMTEKIDQGYKDKYKDSPYLPPMLAEGPQSATVEVSPK